MTAPHGGLAGGKMYTTKPPKPQSPRTPLNLKCKNTVCGRTGCFPHFPRHGFIKASGLELQAGGNEGDISHSFGAAGWDIQCHCSGALSVQFSVSSGPEGLVLEVGVSNGVILQHLTRDSGLPALH